MLNKDELINCTNKGLDVCRHYIPGQWRLGRNFLKPLYKDTNPLCYIYFDKKADVYKFKDFGNDEYSGDCFSFVGKLFGLDCRNSKEFVKILQIINSDLSLGLSEYSSCSENPQKKEMRRTCPILPKNDTTYRYQCKPFSIYEISFWRKYGVNENLLQRYNVVSIQEYSSQNKDGKSFLLRSNDTSPIFGFVGPEHIKLYRPQSDQMRFLYGGDPGEYYSFGLEQLPVRGDTLFITGGGKDVLSLVAHGFPAICFGSENCTIPETIIKALTHRFRHIVILYDVDKTGLESSERHALKLQQYEVLRLLLPLSGDKHEKDISDFFRLGHSAEELSALFLNMLEGIYSETFAILNSLQSVNDEMGSVELIDELYRLAAIYQTCIVCVLHLVPSGMKIRGHLGSEIGRKTAAVISIDKDEKRDVSCLKAIKVRDGSPLDISMLEFAWNKEQWMHMFIGERTGQEKEQRKI